MNEYIYAYTVQCDMFGDKRWQATWWEIVIILVSPLWAFALDATSKVTNYLCGDRWQYISSPWLHHNAMYKYRPTSSVISRAIRYCWYLVTECCVCISRCVCCKCDNLVGAIFAVRWKKYNLQYLETVTNHFLLSVYMYWSWTTRYNASLSCTSMLGPADNSGTIYFLQ